MKPARATFLLVIVASACACSNSVSSGKQGQRKPAASLNKDEKHRLYSAGLAASDSPLDSELFKKVSRQIGIFGPDNQPNDEYAAFVAEHVDWGLRPENQEFRRQIDTRETALEYVNQHLP